MNYDILTQGTKSKFNSLIIRNGYVLTDKHDSINRKVIEKFMLYDKGKIIKIPINKKLIVVKRYKKNYLVEILSSNTDRVGRKVPVEIALDNYDNTIFDKINFREIPIILEREGVSIDNESIEIAIESIDRAIKKEKITSRIWFFLFSALIITALAILLYKLF